MVATLIDSGGEIVTIPPGFDQLENFRACVLWETFASGAARWVDREGDQGPIELVGRGDMVLEVVSDTSENKDFVELQRDYAAVGFSEYWLVDARRDDLSFSILRLVEGAYKSALADADGWIESRAWGRSFKLERETDRLGKPRFILGVRASQNG